MPVNKEIASEIFIRGCVLGDLSCFFEKYSQDIAVNLLYCIAIAEKKTVLVVKTKKH